MLTELQLKEALQLLAQTEFHLPEQNDGSALIPAMLQHIGSPDAVLRDDLIYSAFATWIYTDNSLSPDQLRRILQTALDEQHLFYKIGEENTDSIFRRSFSALLLPLVLIRHRAQPYLTLAEVDQTQQHLLRYLREEKDHRGFVPGKGWAHGFAHSADGLDELAQCAELDAPDLREILQAIRSVICVAEEVYSCGEEERLATAVVAVARRRVLGEAEFSDWLEGFVEATLAIEEYPQKLVLLSNVKNFLQSLHFRLRWALREDFLAAPIEQTLRRINPYGRQEA